MVGAVRAVSGSPVIDPRLAIPSVYSTLPYLPILTSPSPAPCDTSRRLGPFDKSQTLSPTRCDCIHHTCVPHARQPPELQVAYLYLPGPFEDHFGFLHNFNFDIIIGSNSRRME